MKKNYLSLIVFFCVLNLSFGQTTLTNGDLVITGFNSDNPDQFSFVLLTDITTNTEIKFTDNGWFAAGGFRLNEGILTWTATSDLPCGTEVIVDDQAPFTSSTGTITDSAAFALAVSGDQIFAYQGPDASPTFLYGINFDGTDWAADAIDANTSALPPALTNGVDAVHLNEIDNAEYNCSVTTDSALILAAVSTAGNWNTDNGTPFVLGGCTYSCSACPVIATCDGTAWDNGVGPDVSTAAVINGPYSTGVSGSFTACNLEVNANLTIDNGDFVEVVNDVTVNAGQLTTETQGSFVQRGNNFVLAGTGQAVVIKSTTPNTEEDYTYWSSPVDNITILEGLTDAKPNRRYTFNANNYLDTDGDEIDDDGNDWQPVGDTDIMVAGKGYISMHGLFIQPLGTSYDYLFEGAYNNGDITQTVPFNALNTLNHWNLLGNPYPSALDASAFFTANSSVVASELFMWSQVSPPDGANPGNEILNFNLADYITINSLGTAGNGTTPAPQPRVPSGQSFFISSTSPGNVTFTNSMRVGGTNVNNDFYRINQQNNYEDIERLWINLSSDIGVYSQICVAYADSATDGYDGKGIDTERNYAGNAGLLYSMDNNSGGFYVIQGKSKNSLNENEVINLGFASYLSTAELYSISLSDFEGEYLENNSIFLRDNQLGIIHDLKSSDYQFLSAGGDYADRFDIIFNESTLSNTEYTNLVDSFTITEMPDSLVKFSLSNSSLTFDKIEIYDVKGRRIYSLNGTSNLEVHKLSNITNSIFIVKAHISNGKVITKKAIMK